MDDLFLLDDATIGVSGCGHVVVQASEETLRALIQLHANTTARIAAGTMQRVRDVRQAHMRTDIHLRWLTYMNWTYDAAREEWR